MGPVSRVAPFGLRFRRKRKSAIGLRVCRRQTNGRTAGAVAEARPRELPRLGAGCSEGAPRDDSSKEGGCQGDDASSAAAAVTTFATAAVLPLPTPAPAPVPYREEEVVTPHYAPGYPAPYYWPSWRTYESTGACHPAGCCDSGHVLARRWSDMEGGTCDVCKRTVSPVQACWECVPCNWWACEAVSYTHLTLPTIYSV